jgi:hypothetical protein
MEGRSEKDKNTKRQIEKMKTIKGKRKENETKDKEGKYNGKKGKRRKRI